LQVEGVEVEDPIHSERKQVDEEIPTLTGEVASYDRKVVWMNSQVQDEVGQGQVDLFLQSMQIHQNWYRNVPIPSSFLDD